MNLAECKIDEKIKLIWDNFYKGLYLVMETLDLGGRKVVNHNYVMLFISRYLMLHVSAVFTTSS